MRASVPTSVVDNEYENFPPGAYNGEISSAELRDPNNDQSWLVLKIGLSNITPREGTQDPGRSTWSGDITVRTDGVDLFEIEDFSNRDLPFAIRRSAGVLAGLAEAIGVATRENGQVDVDLEAVAAALTEGDFEGDAVGFEVSHFTSKNTGKTYDQIDRFGPAS